MDGSRNLLGPIIERLVSLVVSAVSYLITFLNLLGITTKTASQLSKKAQGAAGDLQRSVAGFDELNVLQQNQGGGSLPELEPEEWMSEFSDLLKQGQFAEAGKYLADQLNQMIESIDWPGIGKKLAYGFQAAIDFLGNFIRDFDAHRLGELVASMFNEILNIDASSWKNLGEILVAPFTLAFDFLTGFLEEMDTSALAAAVSGIIIGALEAITDSIASTDWTRIGENIGLFFESIDWEGIATAIWDLFSTAFAAASDLWEGIPEWLQDIAIAIAAIKVACAGITFFNDLTTFCGAIGKTISGIGAIVGGAVLAVVNFFDMLRDGFDWLNEILMVIGIALAAVGAVILGAEATVVAVIAAIVAAVTTAIVVIKDNWEAIKQWFSQTCTAIGQFFSDLWNSVVQFAQFAWERISNFSSSCVNGLKNIWMTLKTFVLGIWNGVVAGVKGAINSIIGCANGMISAVVSGVNAISSTLNRLSFTVPSWVPDIGGATLGFNLPTFSAPRIPYLEKGGVLKKGQVGLLEGSGAEAVVPLERNTEWINKMADAFMARVQAGSYDLTGNAKTIATLEAIADRVTYRAPAMAAGHILPYSVSGQVSGGGSFDTAGVLEQLQSISEKSERQLELMREMVMLMDQMQFVADFGDNIRALARKITKEQRREQISAGR